MSIRGRRPKQEGQKPEKQTESNDFSAPLGPARDGCLLFSSGASNVAIHAEPAMTDLYRARFGGRVPTVSVRGGTVAISHLGYSSLDWLHYEHQPAAKVALNASIPWSIEMRSGTSGLAADLSRLELSSFDLGGGAGRVELTLPRPSGIVTVRVLGGASVVTIRRPAGTAARLLVRGGSTNVAVDDARVGAAGGEVDLQSQDFVDASARYNVVITGGANAVVVGTYPAKAIT